MSDKNKAFSAENTVLRTFAANASLMRDLIASFDQQLDDAHRIASAASLNGAQKEIRSVVVTGLGGSGIGGKIISQLVQNDCAIPIVVNNDYLLPNFAGVHTLVVVSSYSGNTEETVSAMRDALTRGCQIACISSGGAVTALAEEHQLDLIAIPGGQPPRSQFGYSAVALLRIFDTYGIAAGCFAPSSGLGSFIRAVSAQSEQRAKALAEKIGDRTPVIYSEASNEGIAVRWRQQLNENAKRLCWHHVYPEMNHNELVGWEGGDASVAVILLRSEDDHPRSVARMNISETLFLRKGALLENIVAQGETRLERAFDLIHLGDWLSLVMAERDGINPVSIDAIDYLKDALSKLP